MTAPSLPLPELPSLGAVIGDGRFQIIGHLGEGGMSTVFFADDTALGREVALKLLTPRYVGRPARERRLINEAHYLERLKGYPYLVEIVDHGRLPESGWPWLATEMMLGQTLGRARPSETMDTSQIVGVAHQVALALAVCHEAGIIHRDTTPNNVYLLCVPGEPEPKGEIPRVKLFDFSHAASADQPVQAAGAAGRLTGIHETMGTIGFIGPEQAVNAHPDEAMDIYNFGILLFEMITGENPYASFTDRSAYIQAQRAGELKPPRLHAWSYEVPQSLADILHRCTGALAQRPPMREVITALEAVADELGAELLDREFTQTPRPGEQPEPTAVMHLNWERPAEPTEVMPVVLHPSVAARIGAWGTPTTSTRPNPPPSQPADTLEDPPTASPGPVLAFARPPHLRDDGPADSQVSPALVAGPAAATSPRPQATDDTPAQTEPETGTDSGFDPETETETPQARRRLWWVLLALLLAATAAAVFVSARRGGSPEPEPQTEGAPLPDPAPAGESGEPGERGEHGETGETGETIPDLPPAPEPRPPHVGPDPACAGVEAEGRRAFKARKWAQAAELTERRRCWGSAKERAGIRTLSLFNLGRLQDCARAGRRGNAETRALAAKCSAALDKP